MEHLTIGHTFIKPVLNFLWLLPIFNYAELGFKLPGFAKVIFALEVLRNLVN